MKKKYKDIKPGDVFETEYGDYGNFIQIVFESHEIEEKNRNTAWLKTKGHYKDGGEFVGYAPIYDGRVPDYNVVEEGEK